jgi:hypothetical protein
VIALERMDGPATTTSTDTSALLVELRAIRELLKTIAQAQGLQAPAAFAPPSSAEERGQSSGTLDAHLIRYGDGSSLGDNPHEQEAYDDYLQAEGRAPGNVEDLRQWVLARQG